MPKSKHVREYRTRDGRTQFKPSIQLVMALNGNNQGFAWRAPTSRMASNLMLGAAPAKPAAHPRYMAPRS